jgi:hypothetical protein
MKYQNYFIPKKSSPHIFIKNMMRQGLLLLFFLFTAFTLHAQEICDNGIDDDGDGFVDFFDPDCACEDGNFFGVCTPECVYTAGFSDFALEEQWASVDNVPTYNTPLLADLDLDGIPEIITMAGTTTDVDMVNVDPRRSKNLRVINAVNGITKYVINTPWMAWVGPTPIAIGDIDGDGYPEIIIAAMDILNSTNTSLGNDITTRGRLICYEHDGTLKWISNVKFGTNAPTGFDTDLGAGTVTDRKRFGASVGLADFNQDGIPEVYTYNEIFNATNGVKLFDGGANGIGLSNNNNAWGATAVTTAADVIPSSPGLELIAGQTIYTFNAGFTTMTPNNYTGLSAGDGFTAVADIDNDGLLDAIVSRNTELYVYNPRTLALIATRTGLTGGVNGNAGMPFIGDVDNDNAPEIGRTGANVLNMLEYDGTTTLQLKWSLNTSDGSGFTGITMFDFNQDGNYELVYRDTDNLRIIDGSGNVATNLTTIPCNSGTGAEMPIVGDIDGDGASEICVTCDNGSDTRIGKVKVFQSPDRPFSPARKVWNQYGYHVVNINDDLTVPRQQQNHAIAFSAGIPLNNFLVQATLFDKDGSFIFPASDASIEVDASATNISGTNVTLNMDIINTSAAATNLAPGTKIAFFNGNPATGGTLITGAAYTLNEFITPGNLLSVNHTFAYVGAIPFTLYAVANNDGLSLPISVENYGQAECDYTNNQDFAVIGDRDGDGIADNTDIDDDNDGITDVEEGLGTDPAGDRDGDGIPNFLDLADVASTWTLADVNNDKVVDYFDKDLDGIPNHFDLDSDNDGINDLRESGLTNAQILTADANNDGKADGPYGLNGLANFIESGTDGGVILYDDPAAFVDNDPNGDPVDTDNDNQPDFLDLDSDNDGINDLIEYGLDPTVFDTNNDGIIDGGDADDDGLSDLIDGNDVDFGDGSDAAPFDTDGDGIYDFRDLDSDNDGINDLIEGGNDNKDTNNNGIFDSGDTGYEDTDGDGIADLVDGNVGTFGDALGAGIGEAIDTDGDGVKNFRDLDSDNDSINDVIEGFASGASPDTNGDGVLDINDGVAYADTDGDGISNFVDGNTAAFGDATDPAPINTDGDAVPDYIDLDSDNDSVNDVAENGASAFDTNNDGVIDGNDAGGADNDGDGISDSIDGNLGVFGDNGINTPRNTDGMDQPDFRDLDSDNDATNDINEAGNGALDPNNNGIIDNPTDTDGDGIIGGADGKPTQFGDGGDSDGDGILDSVDLDDDNDGIPDTFEATGVAGIDPSADADGDFVANYIDIDFAGFIDSNGDGVNDNFDRDLDGVPNHLDLDSDNDGIADVIEAGGIDANGDGILDFSEANANLADADNNGLMDNIQTADVASDSKLTTLIDGTTAANGGFYYSTGANRALDTDGDGVPDFLDIDSDNDGIYDVREAGSTDANNDGRIDFTSTFASNDTDRNGWIDSRDGGNGGTSPIITTGTIGSAPSAYNGFDKDSDNVPNFRDLDSDNDGINDIRESRITDADSNNDGILDGVSDANGARSGATSSVLNTDGDGVPNYLDLDSDNDGINDIREANLASFDSNNDGLIDGIDTDGDGIRDNVDGNSGAFGDAADPTTIDTDGDGVPDYRDLDADNDGINDIIESGNNALDVNRDGIVDGADTDNDGIKDNVDGNINAFGDIGDVAPRNTDGDGVADYRDLDSDNDGINDVIEGGYASLDDNGDGVIDGTDVDGDGIKDAADGNDVSFGDANDNTIDTDGDGVLDFRDLDADNDGINDIIEGFASGSSPDTNGNGIIDNADTGAPTDADNDGIWGVQDGTPGVWGDSGNTPPTDTDGDNVPDYQDLDSDNDSINDVTENSDTNGNGIIDGAEVNNDLNGDGVYDGTDPDGDGIVGTADGSNNFGDSGDIGAFDSPEDADTVPNFRDLNSNDGGAGDTGNDINEAGNGGLDVNNDGIIDNTSDPDRDGIIGGADGNPGQFGDGGDSDGDGIADIIDLDDDNDGIPDTFETTGLAGFDPSADQDGDGFPNYLDKSYITAPGWSIADLNNDGVVDFFDKDTDGIPNHLDLDSDNDGIADVIEAGGIDANGDGILDFAEASADLADANNNGLIDNIEANTTSTSKLTSLTGAGGFYYGTGSPRALNTDGSSGDAIPDFLDLDSDNDGIYDVIESGGVDANNNGRLDFSGTFASNDTDNNGWIDSKEGTNSPITTTGTIGSAPTGYVGFDKDSDGVPNFRDLDSDNDGINDIIEAGLVLNDADGILDGTSNSNGLRPGAFNNPSNTDGDGQPDYLDLDTDNDGINDVRESNGVDANNDGLVDAGAGDTESPYGDGIRGTADGSAGTFGDVGNTAPNDRDGDGIPDFRDLDSDNDGINDVNEAFPDNFTADANGDGIVDGLDTDNDGILDLVDSFVGFGDNESTSGSPEDTDGDNVPDYRDLDSDNDGINDVVESGNDALDGNGDGLIDGSDSDRDGILDTVDDNDLGFGDNNANNPDQDNDGTPNYRDLDSDNDGINDVIEGHPDTPDLDTDGDGLVDGADTDGDGIQDSVDGSGTFGDSADPSPVDTDGDGVPDYQDLDSDNDSINDVVEGGNAANDTNNDGIIDGDDTDGDGIQDLVDGDDANFGDAGDTNPIDQAGADADTIPDYRDLDSDGDGLNDIDEACGTPDCNTIGNAGGTVTNTSDPDGDGIVGEADGKPASFGDGGDNDGDGIANNLDIDDDNDGIPDTFEATGFAGFNPDADADSDGIPNYIDTVPGGGIPATDSNGDGVLDYFDRDLDGIPSHLDLDSDNDGISDVTEAGGIDANGDGILDFSEATLALAVGTNGLMNNIEPTTDNNISKLTALTGDGGFFYIIGSARALDTDGDGIADFLDLDADNDGIFDVAEVGGIDANNNGRIDFAGTFASNDLDGNGWIDAKEGAANSPVNGAGTIGSASTNHQVLVAWYNQDGDSRANYVDLDSDNDGINDLIEAGIVLSDTDGILNGTSNGNGARPNATSQALNTDGDGRPDYLDLDSDNDGINDIKENFPTTFATLGANNDGIVDGADAELPYGDGILANADGSLGAFGDNGDGSPADADGDGIPNFRDLDSDDDGINDVFEGHNTNLDTDGNGVIDGTDTDGDGILDAVDQNVNNFGDAGESNDQPEQGGADADTVPDYLDLDSNGDGIFDLATPGLQGLDSNNDGKIDGGDIDGDGIKDAVDGDDVQFGDFGDTGPLPLDLLFFTAEKQDESVKVYWTTINEIEVSHFEIERSANGQNFTKIGQIDARNRGTEISDYVFIDAQPLKGDNYYRFKQVEQNGNTLYSPLAYLYFEQLLTWNVYPNPTVDYINIQLNSEVKDVQIRLTDAKGRLLQAYSTDTDEAGKLRINLKSLQAGSYFIQINADTRKFNKVIIKY